VAIPIDTYFIVTPSSQFIHKAYASLNNTDLFFYITDTGSLRVVNMNSTVSPPSAAPGLLTYSLVQGVKWLGVIAQTGVVHVYYSDASGNLFYFPYTNFGGNFPPPIALTITGTVTFSVIYTPQTTPPVYMCIMDDGLRHNLFVATDPRFQVQVTSQPTVTYNNTLNTAVYLTMPNIAMHPADTNRATVTFQETVVFTSANNVGFYEVRVPGVL
jgi:hypothetical protein